MEEKIIHIVNFKFKCPDNSIIINTTSRSSNWSRGLSPFFLGPVDIYDGHIARNMENAWQYSKCYQQHTQDGEPTAEYFKWAKDGWGQHFANRYPMGKGAVPLYSLWQGQKLSYIEARKQIYIPLYQKLVTKTQAFVNLTTIYNENSCIYLQDFDAHNHCSNNLQWEEIINNPSQKMGHAYVLAMLLAGYLK